MGAGNEVCYIQYKRGESLEGTGVKCSRNHLEAATRKCALFLLSYLGKNFVRFDLFLDQTSF